jgi:hypothetical protein
VALALAPGWAIFSSGQRQKASTTVMIKANTAKKMAHFAM